MSGRDLPIPSGSAHGDLGVWSLCGQTDRVVLLVRAVVARLLESCEATRTGISLGFARVGDSNVAVSGRLEAGRLEVEADREKRKVRGAKLEVGASVQRAEVTK